MATKKKSINKKPEVVETKPKVKAKRKKTKNRKYSLPLEKNIATEWTIVNKSPRKGSKNIVPAVTLMISSGMMRFNHAFIDKYLPDVKKIHLFVRGGRIAVCKAEEGAADAFCLTVQPSQANAASVSCKTLLASIDVKASRRTKSVRSVEISTEKIKGILCPVVSFT